MRLPTASSPSGLPRYTCMPAEWMSSGSLLRWSRGAHGRRRLVELDEGLEGRLGRARARQAEASATGLDFPADGRCRVAMNALIGLDLDDASLRAHAADGRNGNHGLEHRHEARGA